MNENKGFNFLVGIFALWLVYTAYIQGYLHTIGFLAVNNVTGSNLHYSKELMSTTPLAMAVSFLIEAVTVIGYLFILVTTGIWDLLLVFGKYTKDFFAQLLVILKEYTAKLRPVPKPVVDVSVTPVEEVDNQAMLFELLKEMKSKIDALEKSQAKTETNNVA